eukprot:1477583-Prymnesium_polylepis.1
MLAFELRDAGLALTEGALSPVALRLHGGRAAWGGSIWSLPQWSAGWCEVQDEGSQYVAHATEARPGERVLDGERPRKCTRAENGPRPASLALLPGLACLFVAPFGRDAPFAPRKRRHGESTVCSPHVRPTPRHTSQCARATVARRSRSRRWWASQGASLRTTS